MEQTDVHSEAAHKGAALVWASAIRHSIPSPNLLTSFLKVFTFKNGGAGRSFKHKHTADCKKTQYLEEITVISDIIASYIAVIIMCFESIVK
ncbi:MAG: hypothetical protein PHG81_05755 [Aliarcobacter sp.]|nr:hypothetical protein [Aliarcobacter sp.]